jgi:hypothetical protein
MAIVVVGIMLAFFGTLFAALLGGYIPLTFTFPTP